MSQLPIPAGAYTHNQPYNQPLACQAPITILAPADYDYEHEELKLTIRPFNLTTAEYGNPIFLHNLASCPLQPISYNGRHPTWRYEDRQKVQNILPFIHLGPASAARDRHYIVANGITMAVAVRSAAAAQKLPRLLDPARFPSCEGLETATFDIDTPFELIHRVRPILRLITAHLEQQNRDQILTDINQVKGKIFVFCETGNDRSPVLVATYLMLLYGISWSESLNLIHVYRFSVGLSTSMNEMLSNFEMVIKAQWDVSSSMSAAVLQQPEQTSRRAKRTIDDVYDSDDTMTDEVTLDMRPGIAPFLDVL